MKARAYLLCWCLLWALAACNSRDGGIIGNGIFRSQPLETSVSVQLLDARTGAPLVPPDNDAFLLTVGGKDKDLVRTTKGEAASSIPIVGGLAVFTFEAGTAPTPEAPLELTLVASGAGYLNNSAPVFLDSTGAHFENIPLVEIDVPPPGVSTGYFTAARTDSDGSLVADVRLDTAPDDQENGTASLEILKGTVLRGAAGEPLAGTLSISVTYFNNRTEESLDSFPGGFGVDIGADELGNPAPDSAFISGGFVAVEITDESGTRAESFDQPIDLAVQVPGTTINPETGLPVGDGDTVPVWSYDETTGEWTYEGTGTLSGPDGNGNFIVAFSVTHLSYWNIDWRYGGCNTYLNLQRNASGVGVPLKFTVSRTDGGGGYLYQPHSLISDNRVRLIGAPIGIPLRFEASLGGTLVGQLDHTFTAGCASVAMPVTVPPTAVSDVAIELHGACAGSDVEVPIPSFSYAFYGTYGKTSYGSFLGGAGTAHNIPLGQYSLSLHVLGTGVTSKAVWVPGLEIDGFQDPVIKTVYFDCRTGEPDPVRINYFWASSSSIVAGNSSTLYWGTTLADSCTINGSTVPVTGTMQVSPPSTTYYTLRCQGPGGPVAAVRYVWVVPNRVRISYFYATPTSILDGQKTTLYWGVTLATSCSLTGVGAVSSVGSVNLYPSETTLYTLTCQGNLGPATRQVQVIVQAPPVAGDDAATTDEDVGVDIAVLANDADPNLNPFFISDFTQPASGAVTDNFDGTLYYAPDVNFFGADSFTYSITDSTGLSDTATVNLTVTPVNDLPVASGPGAIQIVLFDTPSGPLVLTGSDVEDPEASLTVTVTSGPGGGSLDFTSGAAPLGVVYTPNSGFTGSDSFDFIVTDSDGGDSSLFTVSIQIAAADDPPTATAVAPITTDEDVSVQFTLTGTDVQDVESQLAVSVTALPTGGTLDVASGGAPLLVTYTPDPQWSGSDSLDFLVTDSDAFVSSPVTVNITVNSVNDLPVAMPVSPVGLIQDTSSSPITLTGTDVEDTEAQLTVNVTSGPSNGSLDFTMGAAPLSVVYTPNMGYVGGDSFDFTVTDLDLGISAPVTVTLNIGAAGAPTQIVFTSAPQSLTAGVCSGQVTLETQDLVGIAQNVMGNTTVDLAADSGSLAFFSDASCTTPLAGDQAVILTGTSTAGFYFSDTTAGTPTITASDNAAVLTSGMEIQTINPNIPSQLTITSAPMTLAAGTCSAAATVQTQDVYSNPSNVAAPVTVDLTADSVMLTFYSDAACTPGNEITQVTVSTGANSAAFYFSDQTAGTPTITVDDAGLLIPAMQMETINPAVADNLFFSAPPQTNETAGNVWTTDGVNPIQVAILDAFGNLVASDNTTQVGLSLTSGSGTINGTITQTAVAGVATFGDISYDVAEMITVDFTAGALTSISGMLLTISPAAAAQLSFGTPPASSEYAGLTWGAFTVEVQDSFGNLITTDNTTQITITGDGTAAMGGFAGNVQIVVAGVATFSAITYGTVEGINVGATSVPAYAPPATVPVTILSGIADHLAFGVVPSAIEQQDQIFSFFTVKVEDAANAVVTGDNATVVTISLGSGTGTLSGTLTRMVQGGVAVFNDVTYDTAENIDLQADSMPALTPAISPIMSVQAGPATQAAIVRASQTNAGTGGNGVSADAAISADGRYVAFESIASNLVAGDANGVRDVFLRDRTGNTIGRVSVSTAGTEGDGASENPALSAGGRFVAFESDATNLVAGDTNVRRDIFVRDLQLATTSRVSVHSSGTEGNSNSLQPALSADGRYVAFDSLASNLVAGDTNAVSDVFVHDQLTGTTVRVSVDSAGGEADANSTNPALSATGRFVAFQSDAVNLVAGDTNGVTDIFLHDRDTDADGIMDEPGAIDTIRVSVDSSGFEGNGQSQNPAISSNGQQVVFESMASNLIAADTNGVSDVFVAFPFLSITGRVSKATGGGEGNGASYAASYSAGRFIAFVSDANNLVAGDTNAASDVFVHDLDSNTTVRASVDVSGVEGTGSSLAPAISLDGRFVAFGSAASNLIVADVNGFQDVFVAPNPLAGPYRLVFNPAPAASETVSVTWTTFSVEIQDVLGTVQTGATNCVMVSLAAGTGVLGGTLTKCAIAGVATFNDVSYDVAEGITIDVTSGVLQPITGTGVTITP